MAKKEEKVNFDLSMLDLHELIDAYNNIDEFLTFLNDSKIELDDKEEDEDE
mgnify:CR=1 FL=1